MWMCKDENKWRNTWKLSKQQWTEWVSIDSDKAFQTSSTSPFAPSLSWQSVDQSESCGHTQEGLTMKWYCFPPFLLENGTGNNTQRCFFPLQKAVWSCIATRKVLQMEFSEPGPDLKDLCVELKNPRHPPNKDPTPTHFSSGTCSP